MAIKEGNSELGQSYQERNFLKNTGLEVERATGKTGACDEGDDIAAQS